MISEDAKTIELRVNYHVSGTRTLTRKEPGEPMPKDVPAPNLINRDAGAFYRFVADYLGDLANRGLGVRYSDNSPKPGEPSAP